MKKRSIFLSVILFLVVTLYSFFIQIQLHQTFYLSKKEVVERYYDHLQKKRYKSAYNLLSHETQLEISLSRFISYYQQKEHIEILQETNVQQTNIKNQYRATSVMYNKQTKKETVAIDYFYAEKENGQWRISSYRTWKHKWAGLYNDLGVVESQKDNKKALFYFKKAIHLEPTYSAAVFNMGKTYENQQNYEQANETYDLFLTKTTNKILRSSALVNMGINAYKLKKYEEGTRLLQQALENDPENKAAIRTIHKVKQTITVEERP